MAKREKEEQSARMEQGTVNAAVEAARNHIFGGEGKQGEQKGFEILMQYAGTNNAKVHGLLGMIYYNGLGDVEADYGKALEHMLIAIENGDEISIRTAGFLLTGIADESLQDYPKAIELLGKAAENGETHALIYLAMVYSDPDYDGWNEEKALEYLGQAERKMAETTEETDSLMAVKHRQMADIYYKFCEKEENHRLAFEHYCKALSAGEILVVYDVGWMYFEEECESTFCFWSADELIKMLKDEEAKSDEPLIAILLGDIYCNALRQDEDKEEAAKWYRKAWDKGDFDSGRLLAEYYFDTRQERKYFGILKELHEDGDYEATYRLGECYEGGIGVEQDVRRGKELKELADIAHSAAEDAGEIWDKAAEAYD